jgi:hypothetical protein
MADVTPMRPPATEQSFIRGIRACISMLEQTRNADEFFVQAIGRHGPQNNVVRRAIGEVLERGDDRELEGFCAVLIEICAISDNSGDYTRIFKGYANRRERVLRRRYRRATLGEVAQAREVLP